MGNDQIKYYGERNISPERQNIDDIQLHYARRNKLYRQCGLPEMAFRNAEMMEVGPGGGYNTLAYFQWGCKHIDLIEGNPQGIRDMKMLFAERKIPKDRYDIFNCLIEDYQTDRRYDIIVAEGFLPDIDNQKDVVDKLKTLLGEKGVIVITCVDKVGFFIESMKRLVGAVAVRDIPDFEDKVKYLTDFFKPQLAKLRGMSKLPEDWVKDIIVSPMINNGIELSLGQAIRMFQEEFDILGTSPQLFTDYSWSKDIWYDYKKDYLEQFDQKRLSLLMAGMPEVILPSDDAKILVKGFEDIKDAEAAYENTLEMTKIDDILGTMESMDGLLQKYFTDDFMSVFYEIKDVLLCLQKSENVDMEKYPDFFKAFGRTQQYISFVKK